MKEKDNKIKNKSLKDLTDKLPQAPANALVFAEEIIVDHAKKAVEVLEKHAEQVAVSLEEQARKVAEALKKNAENISSLGSTQSDLSDWIKKNIKKLFIWTIITLLINAILICILVTGSWIVFKTYYFKEIPSQQKQIADMTFNGYHLRDMGNNKFLLNANNPTKKAYILDFSKDKITHVPKLRVDKPK